MGIGNDGDYDAVRAAINAGCTLIDTAPNYVDGASELLVGKVLRDINKEVFITTKAGYIQGVDMGPVAALKFENVVKINNNFSYSIDPNFLSFQLQKSLNRLGKSCIDGFFLHNPEHYFSDPKDPIGKPELYNLIKKAFSFLEEQVSKGKIRYYGISSNTFPFSSDNSTTLDIQTICDLAKSIATTNHFKIIQFPYNILETEATTGIHSNGKSLLSIAKGLGLQTFSNRPLNGSSSSGAVRLVTHYPEVSSATINNSLIVNVLDLIHSKLDEKGMADQWDEFPVLVELEKNWNKIGNPEGVASLFGNYLMPFMNALYEEKVPVEVNTLLELLFHEMDILSKRNITIVASRLEKDLIDNGLMGIGPGTFPKRLCQYYLSQGVDHVLVGMRKKKYVEELTGLF